MALIINEVIVEAVAEQPTPSDPSPQQMPLSVAEQELAQTLALIQQRQARLRVD